MQVSFESIGWYFSYDKEGRYPIDTSKPIALDNGEITVYLSHRPIQQEDGSWVEWFVVEGNGERVTVNIYSPLNSTDVSRAWADGIELASRHYVVIAGDKKNITYDISFEKISVEEIFVANDTARDDLFLNWPNSAGKISDYTDVANGVYVKFEDYEGQLGGKTNTGDKWVALSDIPIFIGGINYKAIDLANNRAIISGLEYSQNSIFAFLGKVLQDSDEDVVLVKTLPYKIFWNHEDYNIYLQLTPLVGEGAVFKISNNIVNVGDNIYIVVKKEGNKLTVNCNGYVTEFSKNFIDYPEQYVEQNEEIKIEVINPFTNKSEQFYYELEKFWTSFFSGSYYFHWLTTTFISTLTRGDFINEDILLKVFPGATEENIKDFSVKKIPVNDFLKYRLYTKPIPIKISNITKPFYLSAVLNPVTYSTLVKRTWRVKNNELVYDDEIFVF